jgi:hypothetical protein
MLGFAERNKPLFYLLAPPRSRKRRAKTRLPCQKRANAFKNVFCHAGVIFAMHDTYRQRQRGLVRYTAPTNFMRLSEQRIFNQVLHTAGGFYLASRARQ